ncbi:MAG: DUF364 domain-containing protein [Desulfovibrionaceae bacterium]
MNQHTQPQPSPVPVTKNHVALCAALLDQVARSPHARDPVDAAVCGSHLAAVRTARPGHMPRLGLAARVIHNASEMKQVKMDGHEGPPPSGTSALAIARELGALRRDAPLAPSWALAACNALLPTPDARDEVSGQELIYRHGAGKRVAVVGHFPFVEKMGPEFAALWVLEINPRPGDLPASDADGIIPRADVVAITSMALQNGTMGGLLALCAPGAFVMVLGPGTPLAPVLFEHGVHALAGVVVTDAGMVMDGVARGDSFRQLSGVRRVVLVRG